jgi:biopolymer transport protein ExbD
MPIPDRRRRTHLSGLARTGRLKLTSMMDILVVLLLFLLKSFVVEGEAMTPTPGVTLPESTSPDQPRSALVVSIVDDTILVGGEPVATLDASSAARAGAPIPGLLRALEDARHRADAMAARTGNTEAEARPATIQADRELPFHVLQRVMLTLGESGYEEVSLAVIRSS